MLGGLRCWSSCDDHKDMALTHKKWSELGRTSQLDYLLGPGMNSSRMYTTKVKLWPALYAAIREDDGQGYRRQKKKKGWAGCRPYDDKARIDFKKAVMDRREDVQKEDLDTI